MLELDKQKIVCLMGPTACGKTALSYELARFYPFEIISVDSALIYRGLNIGTAKPSQEEIKQHPHHLIDILDAKDSYSVKQFEVDVTRLVQDIFKREHIPLLVGGTMLYFKALQFGLNELPESCKRTRDEINNEATCHGWQYMHQQLKEVDEPSFKRIHPNDSQRIQRALEVFRLSNKPLSSYYNEKKGLPYPFINLGILPLERALLHHRIEERFYRMIENGFIEEVRTLKDKGLTTDKPSMRLVGYRQVMGYLNGEYDKSTMINKGIEATRQLAKRQLTWLRKWPDLLRFTMEEVNLTQLVVDKLGTLL